MVAKFMFFVKALLAKGIIKATIGLVLAAEGELTKAGNYTT